MAKTKATTAPTTDTPAHTVAAHAADTAPSSPYGRQLTRHRIECVLEATSPICHLAATSGNIGTINRRPIRQRDGEFTRVPEISGDAMRHGLREAAAYLILDASGIANEAALSEAALRLLFAGGMVTGQGDAGNVKMREYRQLVDLVPSMALLGGCAQNRTIPGRVNVEPATLICEESEGYLPAWVKAYVAEHFASPQEQAAPEFVDMVQRVRMDPTLDPGKRMMLDPGAADATERRLEASERASAEGNTGAKDAAKSSMMPRRTEVLVQGSLFYWAVEATCYNDLDVDTFHTMWAKFAGDIIVGGKRAVGFGRLRCVKAHKPVVARFGELPDGGAELALRTPGVGALVTTHIRDRAAAIRDFLRVVNA